MRIIIDPPDDEPDQPELITDPFIKRYAYRLHMLTLELVANTEYYELNRVQIDQFINSLKTLYYQLGFTEDLERLDAMLRMSFSGDYYTENENLTDMLTDYSLSTSN